MNLYTCVVPVHRLFADYVAIRHLLHVVLFMVYFHCANLFWLTDKALSLGFNPAAKDFRVQ